jgi:glycosyltransferase involved in cell wall biosynthesis
VYRTDHTFAVEDFIVKSDAVRSSRDARRATLGLRGTTFVYVGRLWWGKGLPTLLEAYRQLDAGDRASLLLVGGGPEEDALRRIAADQRLPNVVFAGFQQQHELPRLYALADVFVFPTLGDPWGLVVEEAMACGLPVISTTEAGEIRDRIRPDETGYVVPPDAPEPLREAMRRFIAEPAAAAAMGAAARSTVTWRTPDKWATQFAEVVARASH